MPVGPGKWFDSEAIRRDLAEIEEALRLCREAVTSLEHMREAVMAHLALIDGRTGHQGPMRIVAAAMADSPRVNPENETPDDSVAKALSTAKNSPVVQTVAAVMALHIGDRILDRDVYAAARAAGLSSRAKSERGALGTIRWALQVLETAGVVRKVAKGVWTGLPGLTAFVRALQPDPLPHLLTDAQPDSPSSSKAGAGLPDAGTPIPPVSDQSS